MTIFGPDLSHYQQGIDLAKVAAEGHQFVICKVSQGAASHDPAWPVFREAARAHGLLLIGYHMVTGDDPAKQAANCRAALGDTTIPLALDWESSGGSGNWANLMAVLTAFRAAGLNVRLGYFPRWYFQQQGSPDMSKAGLPLWSSRYVTAKGAPADVYKQVTAAQWAGYGGLVVALVQFTDSATVAGITCDCSAFAGTRDQLAALLGVGEPATTTPASSAREDDDMAPAPLPVTYLPDGRYRIVAKTESDKIGSQLFSAMWISYSSHWGDSTCAITALDGAGNIIDGGPDKVAPIKNNVHQSYTVPAKATTVTLEGKVAAVGDTEVAAFLLAKPL